MPVLQSATREDIRLAVGYNLNAVFEGSLTAAAPDASTFVDTKVRGGDGDQNGKWVLVTSGARDGDISRVTGWASATNTFTVSPAFGGTLVNAVTYELWNREFRPQFIHNCINQAIHYITGKAYDPEEDITLHLHGDQRRYVIPASFAAISKLERRRSVTGVVIDPCESGWTEQPNVTQAFDTTRRREGSAALRLILAAAAGANADIASKTITSLNLSKYDTLELWLLSSVAVATSGDLTLRLTSGSTTISFDIPTLSADTWTFHRIAMTAEQARQLTAVTTVVIRQVTDIGAATVWVDDIKAVMNSTAQWERIDSRLWYGDKEAGEIVFKPDLGTVPYNLLKITGGDEPVLLNADATVSEVDPMYLIAKATELAMMAVSGSPPTDPEARRQQMGYWAAEAYKRILSLPNLANWRQVR